MLTFDVPEAQGFQTTLQSCRQTHKFTTLPYKVCQPNHSFLVNIECESFQRSSQCLRTELDLCDLSKQCTSDKKIKEKVLFENLLDLCKVEVNTIVFCSIFQK